MASDFDSPWKEAIQQYLRGFLAMCFPEVEEGIDWSRTPEFLEQELRALVPESELGAQQVDQLIRVWQKNGQEQWVLLHVEVQSQVAQGFPKRLFQYHGRLTDRYGVDVATLCLLADDVKSYRPDGYDWEFWGCRVRFTYPTCKLLDFQDEKLAVSANPIAVVIRAHLAAKNQKEGDQGRFRRKKELVLGLYQRGLSSEEVRKLFNLVDWLIRLPKQLELEFQREIFDYERRNHMPYISSIERIGIEKGLEQGREEARQSLRAMILQDVESRWGSTPLALPERLSLIHSDAQLRDILRLALSAAHLEQFEAGLDSMGV